MKKYHIDYEDMMSVFSFTTKTDGERFIEKVYSEFPYFSFIEGVLSGHTDKYVYYLSCVKIKDWIFDSEFLSFFGGKLELFRKTDSKNDFFNAMIKAAANGSKACTSIIISFMEGYLRQESRPTDLLDSMFSDDDDDEE